MRGGFRAEAERRSRLSFEEWMAEDGQNVLRRLEREPTTSILLQPSPPSWAGCSAGKGSHTIRGDNYRTVLGSRDRMCFHISCIGLMVDLVSLSRTRFALDTGHWHMEV